MNNSYSWDHDKSMEACALLYSDEKERDVERGLALLRESGDYYSLAGVYCDNRIIPTDVDKAIKIFHEGVQAGSHWCQYGLATLYDTESGVGTDPEEAFRMMQKAYEMGCPGAIFNLANYFEKGLGVEQNYSKAFDLYKRNADLFRDKESCHALARLYRNGLGVDASEKKSVEYDKIYFS